MTVLTCSHCGAPRDPRAGRCGYCGVTFADPRTGLAQGEIDPEIEGLIRSGNKIGAIKRYHDRHKCGLREAKDAIEAMAKRLGA